MSAAARLFVHVGLHKTGTTYLQNVMRANAEALRAQGVDFPDRQEGVVQRRSAFDLIGHRPRGYNDPRIEGAWDALVAVIRGHGHPTALISEEMLCWANDKQARRAVDSFPDREVHVIVTARDLGRAAVSAWQQYLRDDTTWTWREYVTAVRDPSLIDVNPARAFWGTQDLPKICATWAAAVSPQRVHIVTVPPPSAPRDALMARFASVVGFDPSALTQQAPWSNENIGVAGAEVIRQINVRLGNRLNRPAHGRVIDGMVARMLAERNAGEKPTLPPEDVEWAAARADEMIAAVTAGGYRIVGDVEDLRVRPLPGRRPDDATTDELLEASLDVLATVAERFADAWWVRNQARIEAEHPRTSLRFKARGAAVAARRQAGRVIHASPTLIKAMAAVRRVRNRLTS